MIIAPRRTFDSFPELAAALGCHPNALYRYLEHLGRGRWRLRPLDEVAYRRWHTRHGYAITPATAEQPVSNP